MVFTSEQVNSYIRIVVYWVAGFAVNYGIISSSTETAVAGAVVTALNLVWTLYGSTALAKLNEIAKLDVVKTVVVTTEQMAKATPSPKIVS